jgi:hypothetical protein
MCDSPVLVIVGGILILTFMALLVLYLEGYFSFREEIYDVEDVFDSNGRRVASLFIMKRVYHNGKIKFRKKRV